MSERLQSSSALLQFGFVAQRSPVGAQLGSLLRQILQVNIVLGTPTLGSSAPAEGRHNRSCGTQW
jgi:hypothetical protein